MKKHELKNTGPNVAEKIFDSWMINGYYIYLYYGAAGGLFVKISLDNDVKRAYPTDFTHNVALLYLNAFMCAADRDAINTLPEKPFHKRYQDSDLLYFESKGWEKYKSQFERFEMDYIEELNEELIAANLKAIRDVNNEEWEELAKRREKDKDVNWEE